LAQSWNFLFEGRAALSTAARSNDRKMGRDFLGSPVAIFRKLLVTAAA
jgi:hypothetical protein